MTAPLVLQLTAAKPETIAGEGIVLNIAHKVSADLEMETVELNRSRTALCVTPLANGGGSRILTGADYVELHRVHPFSEIGRSFHAPAGSAWVSQLALLDYTQPLEVGRYRVELSYRYGESPEETVFANAVEVEVVPAELLTCEFRWFAGSVPRDQLGAVWTAERNQEVRWIYQTSSGKDPGAVLTALDLQLGNAPRAHPLLAHLNDIAAMHYERYVVWIDGERLGYLKVSDEQRLSDPAFTAHRLPGESKLIDPPLQRRGGGLWAAVSGADGNRPLLGLVEVDAQGNGRSRTVEAAETSRGAPVIVWSEESENPAGCIYSLIEDRRSISRLDLSTGESRQLKTPGNVLFLDVDQWLGSGVVLALTAREDALEVVAWDHLHPEAEPRLLARYEREKLRAIVAGAVAGRVTLVDPPGLALLFPGREERWTVLARSAHRFAKTTSGGTPHLVGTRAGLFLMEYLSQRGFSATPLDGVAPPELL